MLRANTLVDPPGSTASAVRLSAMPAAISFSVPSPPKATTTSTPRLAASWAKRVAWPRLLVSTICTSWPCDRTWWTTTVLRAVTEDAKELTTRSSRTRRSTVSPVGCLARVVTRR